MWACFREPNIYYNKPCRSGDEEKWVPLILPVDETSPAGGQQDR
jgi:hypothetical protein